MTRPKNYFFLICVVLALGTVALYWPITSHPFVNYDDEQYVTVNTHVTTGLGWTNLVWAFQNDEAANWHPVTWLSHQLDCTLFGLHAGAHHFVNLLFHVANTLLVFIFLYRATGALWRAALVAAFFAWHPLHVESVAWASERKDMLSTFFWLLALLAYLGYAKTRMASLRQNQTGLRSSLPAYLLTLFFFALGLMSKPMVVTLPCVLFLMDFWPLGRLTMENWRLEWKRLVLEKIPFFILAAAGSAETYLVQNGSGAVWQTSLSSRLANAVIAYARYVIKMFWPDNLAVIYAHPKAWPDSMTIGALALLLLWTMLMLLYWRRRPYLLVGWFWFLGTLVPTIGLVQVGAQSMADRYTYIPSIGFFILVVWGVADFVSAHPVLRKISCAITGAALTGCLMATSVQIGYWRDSETLFMHALVVSPDNYIAANSLGKAFEKAGDQTRALVMYKNSVELESHFPQSQFNYAMSLLAFGQNEDAFTHLNIAAQLEAHDAGIQQDLGNIFAQYNSFTNALNCFSNVVSLTPNAPIGHLDLGSTLANLGRFAPAADQFREALRLNPDFPAAKTQLDRLLADHPELR